MPEAKEVLIKMILIVAVIFLLIDAGVKIAEKDKRQEEQIKLLEQSLNEQIQEKQVYMNMLEEERIK